MKPILIELDELTAGRLEVVASARSRLRSEFVRRAIRRALDEEEEKQTEEAYRRQPQEHKDFVDPDTWESATSPQRKVSPKRRKR